MVFLRLVLESGVCNSFVPPQYDLQAEVNRKLIVGIGVMFTSVGYLSPRRCGLDGCSLCNIYVVFVEDKAFWPPA